MKISSILVKTIVWSDSEYSNTIIWWYVNYLTLVYGLKDKSIKMTILE